MPLNPTNQPNQQRDNSFMSIYCDAAFKIFIPEREFFFARVKSEQSGTWSLAE